MIRPWERRITGKVVRSNFYNHWENGESVYETLVQRMQLICLRIKLSVSLCICDISGRKKTCLKKDTGIELKVAT